MPHLAVFRRGWQNEHLAAFILSKFAFVAHPAKIGDDVGTDFFCTFFETIRQEERDYLIPKSSFAIQVKSGGTSIDVTNQIEYLYRLELPFFVGIVEQEESSLNIYSGEYLPILFPHKGIPTSLILELCSNHDFEPDEYCEEVSDNEYKLKCPKVSTMSAVMPDEAISGEASRLSKIAERIQKNIAASISNEYIFSVGSDGHIPAIMAGSGSVQVFRENFKKRLAEVFHNFAWIIKQPNHDLDIDEFRFYERIYDKMGEREGNLPIYLTSVAKELKNQLSSA